MSSNNHWHIIGAAVIGVIGAATVFIIEHVRQERRRHALSKDMRRLDEQLGKMRHDLDQLRALQQQNNEKKSKRSRRKQRSVMSTTTSDDFSSMPDVDSSDMEFYDLSDDDDVMRTNDSTESYDKILEDLDGSLEKGSLHELRECLEKLRDLCMEHPESPELLWRIGKAHYNISKLCGDAREKRTNIEKGIEACDNALLLNPECSESHKWYAILVGSRSDFQSTKDKIKDGHVFKKHIDIAIDLNPSDPSLHHLLGRFSYEVAGLKWYERKIAAALEAEPPSASYDDALRHFLKAEELSSDDWKENKMLIGKCHIACGDYKSAVDCLQYAMNISSKNEMEQDINAEIKTLMDKYDNSR